MRWRSEVLLCFCGRDGERGCLVCVNSALRFTSFNRQSDTLSYLTLTLYAVAKGQHICKRGSKEDKKLSE